MRIFRLSGGPLDFREGVPATFTLWMFMLLAAMLALLVWAAVKDVTAPTPQAVTLIQTDAGADRLVLTPVAGAPIPLERAWLEVTVDGAAHAVPLTLLHEATDDGHTWRAGERLCAAGPDPGCAAPAGVEMHVRLIVGGHVMADSARSGGPSTPLLP